jgi:replicative DNA helicase
MEKLDVEEAIIGALLIDSRAILDVAGKIKKEMFSDTANAKIFNAIMDLYTENKPIDLITVNHQLGKNRHIDITPLILASKITKIVSSANIEAHCAILKEHYIKKRCNEIGAKFFTREISRKDFTEQIDELQNEFDNLQLETIKKDTMTMVGYAVSKLEEDIKKTIEQSKKGIFTTIYTGLTELDKLLLGFKRGQMIVVAARPRIGKTSLALAFAKSIAESNNAVFFSLEMSNFELTRKLILSECNGTFIDIYSDVLNSEEKQMLQKAKLKISQLRMFIDDSAKQSITTIITKLKQLKKAGKLDIAFIDYLQLLQPVGKTSTREQEVAQMSRMIKLAAKELDIPIVVLCQLNRAIEGKEREPLLSDIRESGSIEQDADVVMFIDRPYIDDEPRKGDPSNLINLFIRKNRAGRSGVVKLLHNQTMSEFIDYLYG